ncbi:endonuclease [Aquipuribacter nitratireducens]|uniref:Endonuclease n=1 Tax=Aquipuribacter nitratireducens TaxID=650104 RepID=A0ABW0GIV3_9MICO
MSSPTRTDLVRALLDAHGTTYAAEAGIRLKDTPSPLFRLLVLANLLSARIDAGIAVASARALSSAGMRTPKAMAEATWQERVDALGEGGYRRYDERTATMLGDTAELVQERWRGDLRRMHGSADDVQGLRRLLEEVPGIGPTGSAIYCREVQGVRPEVAPFLDDRVLDGARAVGLPDDADALAGLVSPDDLPRLAAACTRVTLDDGAADRVRDAAA